MEMRKVSVLRWKEHGVSNACNFLQFPVSFTKSPQPRPDIRLWNHLLSSPEEYRHLFLAVCEEVGHWQSEDFRSTKKLGAVDRNMAILKTAQSSSRDAKLASEFLLRLSGRLACSLQVPADCLFQPFLHGFLLRRTF